MKTTLLRGGRELSARFWAGRNVIFAGNNNYGALAFRNEPIAGLSTVERRHTAGNILGALAKGCFLRSLNYPRIGRVRKQRCPISRPRLINSLAFDEIKS